MRDEMRDEKRYYRLSSSIAFENGYDINGQGFVTLSLPFKLSQDAVKYTMAKLPQADKHENPIIQNKDLCRQLSTTILPEVDLLMMCVEQMIAESAKKIKALVNQRDEKPNDIIGMAERDVLQERAIQQIGYNMALHDVWQMLNKRRYELWECSRLKSAKKS